MWTTDSRHRYESRGCRYPSDLTDEAWVIVDPLLSVSASGNAEVLVEPVPWRPRRDARRRSRIVDEQRRREGDPAIGGSTRQPIMTAYRQQALACAAALQWGPARAREPFLKLPTSSFFFVSTEMTG